MPSRQIPPIGDVAVGRDAGSIFVDGKHLFTQHAALQGLGNFGQFSAIVDRALYANHIDGAG